MTLAKKKKRAKRSIAARSLALLAAGRRLRHSPGLFQAWTRWCTNDFVDMQAWADGGYVYVHAFALASSARCACRPLPPALSVYRSWPWMRTIAGAEAQGPFVSCFDLPGNWFLGSPKLRRFLHVRVRAAFLTATRISLLRTSDAPHARARVCRRRLAGHTPGGSSVILSENEAGHIRAFFVRVHASCHDLHGLCGAYFPSILILAG